MILLLIACFSLNSSAQVSKENEVKAAYIYHFFKFIDWPKATADSRPAASVCFFGVDDTVQGIGVFNTSPQAERPLTLQQITIKDDLSNCHLVYIGNQQMHNFDSLKPRLKQLSILSISDAPRFIESGGIIQFVKVKGRIRFYINNTAAKESGLKISAKLLSVADRVD